MLPVLLKASWKNLILLNKENKKESIEPLKNDDWKTILSFWVDNFSGTILNFAGAQQNGGSSNFAIFVYQSWEPDST